MKISEMQMCTTYLWLGKVILVSLCDYSLLVLPVQGDTCHMCSIC